MNQQEFFNRYKYSIRTDKVGGGAFGTVYRAFDEVLNREVAIKVSEVKIMGGKEFSLKDEFDAIKDVPVHPNIANYEELVTIEMPNGIFDYAIMQFYKDGNLSSFIKSNPTLAQKEQVALDLLEGIHHLHKHSIVHRDLKPGNILIVKRGEKVIPVITDFGLSKNAKMEGQSRFSNSFGGGTLKYSSPEQLKAEKLRLNTDLWAYGVIVHEIFTGKNLFIAQGITGASAEAEKEIYEQIIGVDISEMLNELPAKWKHVVEQCLVRDGAKRIKSAVAVKELIINSGASTQEPESFIEDETIVSDAEPEELLDDETIIDDGTATQQKAPKKEPVKKAAPKKKQAKQQKEFKPKFAYDAKSEAKKKRKTMIGVGVVIGLMIISGLAYSFMSNGTDRNWEMAQNMNSIESYESYISLNPESEFLIDAKDNISWLKANLEKTSEAYQSYLTDFPHGKFIALAKENLGWLKAISLNTIESFQAYVEVYSQGLFVEEANSNILKLKDEAAKDKLDLDAWKKAEKTNTINAYNSYLTSFKQGQYRSAANSAITSIKNKNKPQLIEIVEDDEWEAEKHYLKGREFFDKGDYTTALIWYTKAANLNGANGLNGLGYLFNNGLGVKQNYETAIKWYTKAANQGSPKAYVNIGVAYHYGEGVPQNYETAIKWYTKAANEDWASGQWNLGVMYDNGHGVPQNRDTAIFWWRKACDNGHEKACQWL